MVVLVLLHNLAGFGLGYFVTGKLGMGKPQQHSVTLEVGMQNDALALSICAVYFAPAVAIPAAVGSCGPSDYRFLPGRPVRPEHGPVRSQTESRRRSVGGSGRLNDKGLLYEQQPLSFLLL